MSLTEQPSCGELNRDEGLADVRPGADYPVWSPYEAFEAAAALERALKC